MGLCGALVGLGCVGCLLGLSARSFGVLFVLVGPRMRACFVSSGGYYCVTCLVEVVGVRLVAAVAAFMCVFLISFAGGGRSGMCKTTSVRWWSC